MSAAASDDRTIDDSWSLLRRIHHTQVVRDDNLGSSRVSSGAFRDPELSVDAEELWQAEGKSWEASLVGYEGYSLVRFAAAVPRSMGLPVLHRPLANNPAHCEVHGKKTGSTRNKLAEASTWVLVV